jgi:phage terminase Nu1 subunit (DNA packaging protein)
MKRRRSDSDIFGDDPPTPNKGGRPVADHRQQLVLAQAEGQRIKNAKMLGELVPAADVERAWTQAVLDLRAGLLAIPSRLGARLGLTPAQLAALDAELRDAMTALASDAGASDA